MMTPDDFAELVTGAIRIAIDPVLQRIQALEQHAGLHPAAYKSVARAWDPRAAYRPGDLCLCANALYLAIRASSGTRPDGSTGTGSWVLAP